MIKMDKEIIKNDKNIALTIALKYNQLKREYLENLEVEHLVNYIFQHLWRHKSPKTISQAVVEIMKVEAGCIVAYLSQRAVIDSQNKKISDYNDLFLQGAN